VQADGQDEYSGLDELNDELPDDVEDEEHYVAIPDKQELGLSKSLALEFAREFLLNDFDEELLRPLLRHAADDVAHNGGCQYAPRNAAIPSGGFQGVGGCLRRATTRNVLVRIVGQRGQRKRLRRLQQFFGVRLRFARGDPE
jgi:hypothetical protein